MKKLIILLSIALMVACTEKKSPYQTSAGFVQGTTYSIKYQYERDLTPQIDSLLGVFDKSLSNFDSTSILSRTNRNETIDLDTLFINCFAVSQQVYTETDSLFDPTLRPLITAYGFGPDRTPHDLTQKQIDSLLELVGFHKIAINGTRLAKLNPAATLDFSAIAQGYSSDVVGDYFRRLGIRNFLVEIGGEILAQGVNASGEPWRVGIDKPVEGNIVPGRDLQTIIELTNRGLATSGNYRKYIDSPSGKHYTHTIDPRTGTPAHHTLLSVTILAPTAALADGYATACMVGGPEWTRKFIAKHPEIQAYIVYSNGKDMKSEIIGK